MSYEWTVFIQEAVQASNYIPLPPEVQEIIEIESIHGPSVHWHYEKNANYIVLSSYALREPNYVDVGRYQIYTTDSETQQNRIRIPDGMSAVVESHFFEGTRVNYMAYQQMIDRENPTVFLLSNSQFRQLLPANVQKSVADPESGEDITQSLLDIPAFLPPA